MKVIFVFLLCVLALEIKSSSILCNTVESEANATYCHSLEVNVNTSHCCYIKLYPKSNEGEKNFCWELDEDNFKNFTEYLKKYEATEEELGYKVGQFDCKFKGLEIIASVLVTFILLMF